ncbi:MAG: class I SAM-dependent methyltransferase [Gemmatimonadota bacterium]|jgi:SAM-dependent methyltransferase
MAGDFWEDAERVEQFASRAPDHRLAELVERYADPGSVRVLDLGCAGGRNAELLARRGFDVRALDASAAMVARTRARVSAVLGAEAGRERVVRGRMDDLSRWPDGAFDLVVALGVHHSASSRGEWDRAADETARVLASGGLLLFNQFTPEVDLTGDGLRPVPGEPDTYTGFPAGRVVLLDAAALDAAWSDRGLRPESASETVRVELERGRRVSVNALYRKEGP